MTEQLPASFYPARLEIDYPDQHDRVTTLFRAFLIIPIAIVIGVLTTGATQTVYDQSGQVVRTSSGGIGTGLFLATLLMILFARRYPRWWFDFALELARFGARICAYLVLLTDQYPSTVEEQSVHLHRTLPAGTVRFRRRRRPLGAARPGVRDPSRHRPLPALLPHLSPPGIGVRRFRMASDLYAVWGRSVDGPSFRTSLIG